jgi:hypothetical protein
MMNIGMESSLWERKPVRRCESKAQPAECKATKKAGGALLQDRACRRHLSLPVRLRGNVGTFHLKGSSN